MGDLLSGSLLIGFDSREKYKLPLFIENMQENVREASV